MDHFGVPSGFDAMNANGVNSTGGDAANQPGHASKSPSIHPPIQADAPGTRPSQAQSGVSLSKASWCARNRAGLGLLLVAVMIAFGLVFYVDRMTRRDTPEDLALLCTALMKPTPSEGAVEVNLSDAEATIWEKRFVEQVPRIVRRSQRLAPVARDLEKLIGQVERISKNLPSGSKAAFGLAEALLGAYTGERGLVAFGGSKTLGQAKSLWTAVSGALDAFKAKQVLAVELAQTAEELSGPATNSPVVTAKFSEHSPSFFDPTTTDTLRLKNSSGMDLHNVVISVRLSNRGGDSYLNEHFALDWPVGETRVLTYADTAFPKPTVPNVERVDVRVCCTEVKGTALKLQKPPTGWPDR